MQCCNNFSPTIARFSHFVSDFVVFSEPFFHPATLQFLSHLRFVFVSATSACAQSLLIQVLQDRGTIIAILI